MRPALRTLPWITFLLAMMLASPAVLGQVVGERDDVLRSRLLGTLQGTVLSAHLEEVPCREAFRALSRATGVPIIGRYLDDRAGHGIDPEAPVFLFVDEADALEVLELILEQCEDFEPCTWQLRNGFVEVGTKARLAAPSAQETRTIKVRDLLLEPPYFVPPSLGEILGGSVGAMRGGAPGVAPVGNFDEMKYSTAVISRPAEVLPSSMGWEARKRPEELIEEIVNGIVSLVEPGNWDYGQFEDEEPDADDPSRLHPRPTPGRARPAPAPGFAKIARIRVLDDTLVIRAPDFIHRQVNGYPRSVPPPPLSREEREARSLDASSDHCRIVVLDRRQPRSGARP